MAILITGGTGHTGGWLARHAKEAGVPYLVTSRRGQAGVSDGCPGIKFDWTDRDTWESPFEHTFPNGEKIKAVYLVPSKLADPITPFNAFVDYAMKEHNVKRFVMCAGGSAEPGGPWVGQAWQHLVDVGVEHRVLRPTWFMGRLVLLERNEAGLTKVILKGQAAGLSMMGVGQVGFVSG